MSDQIAFVLGGARSGKSRHALALAERVAARRVFVATAQAFDREMEDRIARHRAERDATWTTVDAPLALAEAIDAHAAADRVVLVDCLTLWLTNVMLAPDAPTDDAVDGAGTALLSALARAVGPVILVSNEVGLGIVPDTPLGRRFRDAQGRLNQRVAARAGHVVLVAAGLPLPLKRAGSGPYAVEG